MTNLEALNSLAEKVGGEAQESNAKAIKEIADNFSGGGGGGGLFKVTLTYDDEADDGTYTADKTLTEISEAYNSGLTVLVSDRVNVGIATVITYPFSAAVCHMLAISQGDNGPIGDILKYAATGETVWTVTAYSFDVTEI